MRYENDGRLVTMHSSDPRGLVWYTVEPLNNGHGGDEHFVRCLEVVPYLEVLP